MEFIILIPLLCFWFATALHQECKQNCELKKTTLHLQYQVDELKVSARINKRVSDNSIKELREQLKDTHIRQTFIEMAQADLTTTMLANSCTHGAEC